MGIFKRRNYFQGEERRTSRGKSLFPLRKIYYLIIFLFSLLLFLYQPIFLAYGNWLSQQDSDVKSDIIVALGGTNRLDTAHDLILKGKSNTLYVDSISQEYFQQVSKLLEPSKTLMLWGGENPETTFGEAIAFSKTIEKFKLKPRSITIVTSKYHLRRSRWVFSHVLGNSIEIKAFSAYDKSDSLGENWWEVDSSRKWVVSETNKLLFYWFYYGILRKSDSWDIPESQW